MLSKLAKKHEANMNSVLESITCLALKKLFNYMNVPSNENIVYNTVVSLRDEQRTGQMKFDQEKMGLITGGLLTRPDVCVKSNN